MGYIAVDRGYLQVYISSKWHLLRVYVQNLQSACSIRRGNIKDAVKAAGPEQGSIQSLRAVCCCQNLHTCNKSKIPWWLTFVLASISAVPSLALAPSSFTREGEGFCFFHALHFLATRPKKDLLSTSLQNQGSVSSKGAHSTAPL